MTVESPRIRSLLRQADNVASAGKRAAAEQLYLQIIEEAPETAEAWRGLAQVASSAEQRDSAIERALELDPSIMRDDQQTEDPGTTLGNESSATETAVSETTFSRDGQFAEGQNVLAASRTGAVDPEQETGHEHSNDLRLGESSDVVEQTETVFCANHPGRQTHLRCNRCGKPICSSCANPTPVGYRCPECIREQEDVYFTATPMDYILTALVVLPLSLAIGWIATLLLASPLGFFLIFLGAFSGSLIGRVAFRVAGRRRGRWLPYLVVACVVIGGILPALSFIVAAFFGQFSLRLIFLGIYLFSAAGATYYQMR